VGSCASQPVKPEPARAQGRCYYNANAPAEPGLGPNFPNTDDFWPPEARRKGQRGAVVVNVCVAPDGSIVGGPTTLESSGNESLDQAAIALAKAGTYCPRVQNGAPVGGCLKFRVKFGG
jgi:TonB family protein